MSSLCILGIIPYQMYDLQILYSVPCDVFYSVDSFFGCAEVLKIVCPICLFLLYVACAFGVIYKNILPNPM